MHFKIVSKLPEQSLSIKVTFYLWHSREHMKEFDLPQQDKQSASNFN
jgi:hypothetical protein